MNRPDEPVYRLPTVDEVLSGDTQGGVPRPPVDTDTIFAGQHAPAARPSLWRRVRAFFLGASA